MCFIVSVCSTGLPLLHSPIPLQLPKHSFSPGKFPIILLCILFLSPSGLFSLYQMFCRRTVTPDPTKSPPTSGSCLWGDQAWEAHKPATQAALPCQSCSNQAHSRYGSRNFDWTALHKQVRKKTFNWFLNLPQIQCPLILWQWAP